MKTFQVNLLVLALSVTLFPACLSRKKIKAHIWLNNSPIPQEICDREPTLKDYGLYRRLNDGKYEFVGFCEKEAKNFLAMHKTDFERLMNEATGETDSQKAIKALK